MLQKSSIWNTAGYFFKSPTREHYLMEISRDMQLAHTSLKNNLDELSKETIIQESSQKKGKREFPIYKANLDSRQYKKYKRIFNIESIAESGLIEYLEDTLMPKAIVLFGSYARGEDTEESDIDLFIECKEQKVDVTRFEKRLGKNIQLHFKDSYTQLPKEMKNNIANGIIINGYLEVFK